MGGRSHKKSAGKRLVGMDIQTSLLGQPLPIGWGRARISCNLIDYVNFQAHAQKTSSGGKGLGGGSSSSTTYTYTASVELALCEGPITGINAVWKDSSYYSGGSALSQAGLNVALGSYSQSPWAYLSSLYPTHALNYRGIAYAYAQDYSLGSSGTVSNHGFEVDFAIQFSPGTGIHDALPGDILTDFLTNANYGVPSWPAGLIASLSDYDTYCQAAGIFLSPVLDSTTTASEFVRRMFDETNSDCAFSEGVLKVKPFADDPVIGNGVTWNPALTPVYALTEDDFLSEVQLDILDQSSAYNYVQVEYLDRSNQYQTAIAIAHDLDDILNFGRRLQTPQQFHDICDPQIARNVAQLWLQRQLLSRDQYKFELAVDFELLEPMDYISLTTTVDGLQLNGQLAWIVQIDEDVEGADVLHVIAAKVPGHTATHALYADHSPAGNGVNVDSDPGSVAVPFIWNAPQALTANGYEVWAAVAGVNPIWGGAFVWASFDGVNYSEVGQINGPARYGVLSALLASHADPDSIDTLSVDLTISAGQLISVTAAEADAGATLCWVDGELINFGTATLTAANKYDLTYLRRGQQGSAIGAHANGSHFARLDGSIFKYAYLPQNAGKAVTLKFQSYNVYGRALQDLSVCAAYTITLNPVGSSPVENAAGLALANGTSSWTGNSLDLVCNPVALATSYRWDIYKSDGTTLVRSLTTAVPQASYTAYMALLDGAQRSYKIAVTPLNATGVGTTSSQISVSDNAPAAVSSPTATGGATTATVSCTASGDTDLGGYVVFYSTTTGFNPSSAGTIQLSGTPSINIYGLPAGTYYCRLAAYDPWTHNPALLNLSAEMSFTITAGGGSITGGSAGSGGGYGSGGFGSDWGNP